MRFGLLLEFTVQNSEKQLLLFVLYFFSFTVESEWLFVPNSVAPPALYFNMTKLGAWSGTVDYIEVGLERQIEGARARVTREEPLAHYALSRSIFGNFGAFHANHAIYAFTCGPSRGKSRSPSLVMAPSPIP